MPKNLISIAVIALPLRCFVNHFGYKKAVTLNWVVRLPAEWSIDALPKSIRMMNPDQTVTFTREVAYNKDLNQIGARVRIDLDKSFYTVDEYPDLKEFFKKMVGMLNEQVVFKTNKN